MRFRDAIERRKRKEKYFRILCMSMAWSGVAVLLVLLTHIVQQGVGWISFDFFMNYPSRFPEKAGIHSAVVGTIWLISMTALFTIPVGIATAIYLEEYSKKGKFARLIEVNISNLAAIPSIIYGLLGLTVFVRFLGLGRSLWAGSLTLGLLVLPVVVISARAAIRAVPESIRMAAFGVGATRWQTVFGQVLPAALPGILTGIILALSRAIGETAPLVMIGALSYVAFLPEGPSDQFTTLSIQIFNWASRPKEEFHELAAAAIIVLLAVLLLMNATAVFIRHRSQKVNQW